MSSHDLARLLAPRLPEARKNALRAAEYISLVFHEDRAALLDDTLLAGALELSAPVLRDALVHLESEGYLALVLSWRCPNGRGTIQESREISCFPLVSDCDRCGDVHEFDVRDVTVSFEATREMLALIDG